MIDDFMVDGQLVKPTYKRPNPRRPQCIVILDECVRVCVCVCVSTRMYVCSSSSSSSGGVVSLYFCTDRKSTRSHVYARTYSHHVCTRAVSLSHPVTITAEDDGPPPPPPLLRCCRGLGQSRAMCPIPPHCTKRAYKPPQMSARSTTSVVVFTILPGSMFGFGPSSLIVILHRT